MKKLKSLGKVKTKHGVYKVAVDNKMKWMGDTDTGKKLIRINKKLHHKLKKKQGASKYNSLKDTMQHELRHANHPRESERTVQKKMKKGNVSKSKKYGSIASV
jgi:PDZ domain-containing secreted protein